MRIGQEVWNALTVLRRLVYVRGSAWCVLLLAVCWALAGCASSGAAGRAGGGQSPADSTSTQATDQGSLSAGDFETAKRIALLEAERSARSVSSATALRSAGTVLDSNTGHECTSGSVLHIKLIGTFNIAHGFAPVGAGRSAGAPDDDVHAVLITADPDSGQPCLISVPTGEVLPDHGATVLFTDWTP